MPHSLVITGACGVVGRIVAAQAPQQGRDVLAPTSFDRDLTHPAAVEARIAAPLSADSRGKLAALRGGR